MVLLPTHHSPGGLLAPTCPTVYIQPLTWLLLTLALIGSPRIGCESPLLVLGLVSEESSVGVSLCIAPCHEQACPLLPRTHSSSALSFPLHADPPLDPLFDSACPEAPARAASSVSSPCPPLISSAYTSVVTLHHTEGHPALQNPTSRGSRQPKDNHSGTRSFLGTPCTSV